MQEWKQLKERYEKPVNNRADQAAILQQLQQQGVITVAQMRELQIEMQYQGAATRREMNHEGDATRDQARMYGEANLQRMDDVAETIAREMRVQGVATRERVDAVTEAIEDLGITNTLDSHRIIRIMVLEGEITRAQAEQISNNLARDNAQARRMADIHARSNEAHRTVETGKLREDLQRHKVDTERTLRNATDQISDSIRNSGMNTQLEILNMGALIAGTVMGNTTAAANMIEALRQEHGLTRTQIRALETAVTNAMITNAMNRQAPPATPPRPPATPRARVPWRGHCHCAAAKPALERPVQRH